MGSWRVSFLGANRKHVTTAGAAFLTVAVLMSGCGSGDDDSVSIATDPPAADQTTTTVEESTDESTSTTGAPRTSSTTTTEVEPTTTVSSSSSSPACNRLQPADLDLLGIENAVIDSTGPIVSVNPARPGKTNVSTCTWGIEGISGISIKVSVLEPVAPNTIAELRTQSALDQNMAEYSPVGENGFVHLGPASGRSTKRRFSLLAFGDEFVRAQGVVDSPDEAARLADLEAIVNQLLGN